MKRTFWSLLAALIFGAVFVSGVSGQEALFSTHTPVSTPVAVETPVAPVVAVPSGIPDALQPGVQITVVGFILSILFTALVSIAGTLTAVVLLIRAIFNNPVWVAMIEGIVNSVPADQVRVVNQVGKNIGEIGRAVEEFTDGIPYASKQPEKPLA